MWKGLPAHLFPEEHSSPLLRWHQSDSLTTNLYVDWFFVLLVRLCYWKPCRWNVSLVGSSPLLDPTWNLHTAATPKNSMLASLCGIVGICVFLLTKCWCSYSIHIFRACLPTAFKIYPLCWTIILHGSSLVDIFYISMPSCRLKFLLPFKPTSRGHCCWRIQEGLYPTVCCPILEIISPSNVFSGQN